VALGVARVHAEQVAGEQRGLVAAGAGADLEHRVLGVERILGQEQLDGLLGGLALGLEGAQLLAGQLAQLEVGLGAGHQPRLLEIGAQLLVAAPRHHQRLELRVLARQLAELGAPRDHVGIAEQRRHLFVAAPQRSHLVVKARLVEHGPVSIANRRQGPREPPLRLTPSARTSS
jgi:hypothetical protein